MLVVVATIVVVASSEPGTILPSLAMIFLCASHTSKNSSLSNVECRSIYYSSCNKNQLCVD